MEVEFPANESSIVHVELQGHNVIFNLISRESRGGLKGDNQDVTIVIYITLIHVLQSQRIK